MSKLHVMIDYRVASTILKGIRSQIKNLLNWLDELEKILDKALTDEQKELRKQELQP